MTRALFWGLPTAASTIILLIATQARPVSEPTTPSDPALLRALKTKPIVVLEHEGTEFRQRALIYNELVAELEERAVAYAAGKETEAGLFDVLARVYQASLEVSKGRLLRNKLLAVLAKQADEVRKTMERRLQDKKFNPAQARADLRRATAFSLHVNLEKWRTERELGTGTEDSRPGNPGGGSFPVPLKTPAPKPAP
jgi:hypothetical protein